jgi:hypothetical protein
MAEKRITARWLRSRGACSDQVKVFKKQWPKGALLRKATLLKAARLKLDLDWFANEYLSAPARKAYDEATAPAWKAYEEATAPAWKAYEEARATAWKAYEEARATALWAALREGKEA